MFEVEVTKRRAIAARLLACLLPVALCCVLVAQARAEKPVPPLLSGTNPISSAESPAISTTPIIFGESEPTPIKERAPLGVQPFGIGGRTTGEVTQHPHDIIEIFAGETCQAPAIGRAEAAVFDAEGIQVTVAADAKTTFWAWQVDPSDSSNPSVCSGPLYYWEGNVPPEAGSGENGGGGGGEGSDGSGGGNGEGQAGGGANGSSGGGTAAPTKPQAPHIHTEPGGIANNTAPRIVGNTPAAETVFLYASEGCNGTPIAKGSADQLQSGFQVQVAPNAVTTFSAAAVVGQHSACSEPVAYTEDSTAPRTRITMAPGVKTRKRKAVFRFKDVTEDPPGTTFRCKVDKKKWKPCASPFRVKHLKLGHHILKIRATDLAGNRERKPVKRRFIVIHR
jgi:hypothetical protein